MLRPDPIVSVVMSVYNGERHLRSTINGILNQTYTDFEFIIVDDGSQDGTWEILQSSAEIDSRVRLIRNNRNEGIYCAANRGIHAARGKYIARTDHDDWSFPNRLALQAAYLDTHPEDILVISNWFWVEGDRITSSKVPASSLLAAWFLHFYNHITCQSAVMFRRSHVLGLGCYKTEYPVTADYDLWLRMSRVRRIGILPEHLVWCRREEDTSVTRNRRQEQKRSASEISLHALQELTGQTFDADLPKNMEAFWPVYWKKAFPRGERLHAIHHALVEAHTAFIESWGTRYPEERAVADIEIRFSTAAAFQNWAEFLRISGFTQEAKDTRRISEVWEAGDLIPLRV